MKNAPFATNGHGLTYSNGHNGQSHNGNGHNGNGHRSNGHNGVAVLEKPAQTKSQEVYDPAFEALIEQMLVRVGEDPDRDGLVRTPLRVAKAMDFLTSGYRTELDEVINEAVFEDDGQEMVIVRDIEFYSLCEHHMLPFYGKMHIAYIPDGKIIGLSKLARITDLFARRLQVQERLTNQIADALVEILQPKGVAVSADAAHFCMMMRGVQKQGSTTLTSAMRGVFQTDEALRREFMQSVRG
ncbi:MAG: GTP cyclohydrolase I FolE [Caldilineaceae bacterium]|nr:GTP cyclohydrolase I FolE [Caldilineaceae bacterium]